MHAEFIILCGAVILYVAVVRLINLIISFVDMRYASDCVEDLKFNIMRLFLEQQNILMEFGVRGDFKLHNNKFYEHIPEIYNKMYDYFQYISPESNNRLKEQYISQLKSNYEDNINSINTTILLLNAYSCMHNYARDFLPSFVCDKETDYVENINPRWDHGINGTGGALI